MSKHQFITLRIDLTKWTLIFTVLPVLLLFLVMLTWAIEDTLNVNLQPLNALPTAESEEVTSPQNASNAEDAGYPIRASDLNTSLFALRLPPPPLDALPYEIREPLSNGTSVPVKKRWLWVPPAQKIIVQPGSDQQLEIEIPEGTMWWKEFYIETDRGTFLIERRIIMRVQKTPRQPEGWAFYSSHHLPPESNADDAAPLVLDSTSAEAAAFMFQSTDWLPTQSSNTPLEVRFEDQLGLQYPYLFPGQAQCVVCHAGAAGAYATAVGDPVQVFGLHPNNLTQESLVALVELGWLTGEEHLLTQPLNEDFSTAQTDDQTFEALTMELTGVMRNNCASCHNASAQAAASYTVFIIDPNTAYTPDQLLDLLDTPGKMHPDAYPLVTPGQLDASEIWLRLNGAEGRRRMPPAEGGLPEPDPRILALWEEWIIRAEDQLPR